MPIGENILAEMASQGLEELRAANAGQMAMDAPPIEAPAAPQQSFVEMIQAEAIRPAPAQSMEIDR